MNKQTFLDELARGLAPLPPKDRAERLNFYNEMILDRMEDGQGEEEAVAAAGPVEEVVGQIIGETPLTKLVKERIKPKHRLEAWEWVLLIAGFPVWFPLLISVAAVIFSVYVSLWSVIVSLWAVFGSLVGCGAGALMASVAMFCAGNIPAGGVLIGGGMVLVGLSIIAFFGCKMATKGLVLMGKIIIRAIRKNFARRAQR